MEKQRLPAKANERGTSLVEVLVSLLIFMFIMLGVLQLFSLSLLNDRASEARTDMTHRAQSVMEVIRTVNATGMSGTSGILPMTVGTRNLPESFADPGYDFWGPEGQGIVESGPRCRMSYVLTDAGTMWVVTVIAVPNTGTGRRYLDYTNRPGVRYAGIIRK